MTEQPTITNLLSTKSSKWNSSVLLMLDLETSSSTQSSDSSHVNPLHIPSSLLRKNITNSILPFPSFAQQTEQTILISTQQTPLYYYHLTMKFFVNHPIVDLTGLENAIVITLDTVRLLQQRKIARLIQLKTAYEQVAPSSYQQIKDCSSSLSTQTTVATVTPSSKARACTRPIRYQARILVRLERTHEFYEWWTNNSTYSRRMEEEFNDNF